MHLLQCVLEFQSDHAQWRHKGGGEKWGACASECRPWRGDCVATGTSTHFIQAFKVKSSLFIYQKH